MNQRLHPIEESRLSQQCDRQKQREQEVVLRILVARFAQRQRAHLRNMTNAHEGHGKAGERREEQRHIVVDAMQDQQADERNQRQATDELRAAPRLSRRGQRVVDPLLGQHRAFVVAQRIERVVAVQRRRQLLA